MIKKVKQALTLLEVNIAIFITGILLSTLWGMYHNWMKSYDKAQKMQTKIHTTLYIKNRLEQLFAQIALCDKNFVFTPSKELGESLCLSYTGGPDPDPSFNNIVRSLLYKDGSNRLCLATWAVSLENRVEVLLDKVSLLEFFFFDPQTNTWQNSWPDESDHLPLFVKVHVKRAESDETMIFKTTYLKEPILYLEAFDGSL